VYIGLVEITARRSLERALFQAWLLRRGSGPKQIAL
jgi:hypothetical protein